MIQLRSLIKVADNTGAKTLRVVLIHGGSWRPYGYIADLVSGSVVQADPQGQVKAKQVVKAVIVRTKKEFRRLDGSYIKFDDNAAVIIDSIQGKTPLGTRVFGPIAREIKEAGFSKIASLALEVV